MDPTTQMDLAAALPDAVVIASDDPIIGAEAPSPVWSSARPLPSYLNNAGDGLYVLDEETSRILDANSRGAQMLGYSRDELLRLSGPDIEQRHSPDAIIAFLKDADQAAVSVEGVHRRKDGSTFPVEIRLTSLESAGRKCVLAIVRDITDRKRAEEALLEADRRKDAFLATLGHELRNPLAALRNGLSVLRHAGSGAAGSRIDAAEVVTTLDHQVDQLVRLVDDLLEVSRISLGKITLQKERIDLVQVLRDAAGGAQSLVQERGHRLVADFPPSPIWVDGDPVRLAQIFGNLLNNAAKYTDPGGEIVLRATQDGAEATIVVADNGRGISADVLPHVFELFAQADPAERGDAGGLGIGLSLARDLVRMHGGHIEASSPGLGLGSELRIRLPLAAAPDRADTATAISAARAPLRRVLVIDDNHDVRSTFAMLLQLLGAMTWLAGSGEEGVAMLAEARPDLIFLDLSMPGMDGFETARRMRQQPEGRAAILVALSGWGRHEDRARTIAAGFDAHLVKPINAADVQALLEAEL
jgi:PAS domain S-box-containing protein